MTHLLLIFLRTAADLLAKFEGLGFRAWHKRCGLLCTVKVQASTAYWLEHVWQKWEGNADTLLHGLTLHEKLLSSSVSRHGTCMHIRISKVLAGIILGASGA